jgi:glycosidase
MQGHGWTDHIPVVQKGLMDIEHHMLHFLENHDEQRIASPEFAGDAQRGRPAMVVSATLSTSPTMIYFGQEVGEPGAEDAGYGSPSRTSIFDYIGVPHHQRWMNEKKFDGGQLSAEEASLRDFYKRLLNLTIKSKALMGSYEDIHYYNRDHTEEYNYRVHSFVRWQDDERLLILVNFDSVESFQFEMKIPPGVVMAWGLEEGSEYELSDILYSKTSVKLKIEKGQGHFQISLAPLQSYIFKLQE